MKKILIKILATLISLPIAAATTITGFNLIVYVYKNISEAPNKSDISEDYGFGLLLLFLIPAIFISSVVPVFYFFYKKIEGHLNKTSDIK